ncbi:hypothetical protein BB934_43295 (plasmid) [Microvirga ossetica]|uniref:Uncharacterized protein n=1 Tax=Microvirga ossetica TaxID=1882682 RepID=A0A1B2EYQ8_9HYPH|nr:hypothetical protein BB934_43295 [Microvirga ossetica]
MGSGIIWHIRFPISLVAMDQPRQRISGNACHEQREQRVRCQPLGHGSLAGANVPLGIRILLSCLLDVAFASIIQFTDLSRRLFCNVVRHRCSNLKTA